jgi:hypothetical protein
LIVVALVLSSSNNSTAQLIDSSAQMSNVFGGSISASDLVIDSNGNALFKLNNLSGDNVTIKKIIVGGEESAYNDLVPSTGERMIYLADSNTNCVCQENQKNAVCVVEIVYVTREGLEKKETRNLTIDCVNTAAPSQPLQVSGLGSGTIDDPFVINSCKELQRMKDNLDWHYALGGDINCAETINWNDGLGFKPIGSIGADVNFVGNFDGRGHTISNLVINRLSDRDVGLFGTSNGEISNVGLVNVLIGGDRLVGGLAGISNGSVSNCFSTGSVTSPSDSAGDLVGYLRSGSISNSYWDIVLSGQSSCYKDGNTGCTSTNGDGSDYFGSNGIPFSNLLFDGNWIARNNNYPILSWQ